jgi:hypothetical protein
MKRATLSLALLAGLLAGCGGGGSTAVPPGTSSASAQANAGNGSILLSIPTQAPSSAVRFAQFVSPNASSVSIVVNNGTAQTFDVSATSSLCTTSSGARNCKLTFGAPAGSDTIVVAIFAGPNGTGTTLATTTTTTTVVAGTPFNVTVALNATIGTIVATINPDTGTGTSCNVPIGTPAVAITEGCGPGGATLTVVASDPSGAAITGTAPYATPIQLSANDPSLGASPTSITAPGQAVALSYTGAPLAQSLGNSATISLTIGTQVVPISVKILRQNLYVALSNTPPGATPVDPIGGAVLAYAFGASGTPTPIRTLTSGLTNPVSLFLDSTGNLYVLDDGAYNGGTRNPSIVVFSPGATSPARTITGLGSGTFGSANKACEQIVLDPTAKFIFMTCDDQAIHVVNIASGTLTARLTFSSFSFPIGLAFDNKGNLWVAEFGFNDVFQFPATLATSGTGVLSNSGMIQGPPAKTFWPSTVSPAAVAIDSMGSLYVNITSTSPTANPTNARIGIWSGGSISNIAPPVALSGGVLDTAQPTGINLDFGGNLYVTSSKANQIFVFGQSTVASGGTNPTVLRTISTGSAPGAPAGLAFGP